MNKFQQIADTNDEKWRKKIDMIIPRYLGVHLSILRLYFESGN